MRQRTPQDGEIEHIADDDHDDDCDEHARFPPLICSNHLRYCGNAPEPKRSGVVCLELTMEQLGHIDQP